MTVSDATTDTQRQIAMDRIWETIPPFWGLVRNNLRSIASEKFEISVEQFHILRYIRRGLTSVSELAEVKRISRPAISQAVVPHTSTTLSPFMHTSAGHYYKLVHKESIRTCVRRGVSGAEVRDFEDSWVQARICTGKINNLRE